jgi:hypothetical protein
MFAVNLQPHQHPQQPQPQLVFDVALQPEINHVAQIVLVDKFQVS